MSRAHIKASEVSARYGFTTRYWIRLAAAGKLPGAWQNEPGGHWQFDAAALAKWQRGRVREVDQWQGFTREVQPIGRAPSVRVSSTGEASKQKIEQLLKNVLGDGSKPSKASAGSADHHQ